MFIQTWNEEIIASCPRIENTEAIDNNWVGGGVRDNFSPKHE